MAEHQGEIHSTVKHSLNKQANLTALTSIDTTKKFKDHDATDKANENANALDREQTLRGLVASRVEQINSSPLNSPAPQVRLKTSAPTSTKARKRNKLKMVGAKNGKLSVEEDEEYVGESDGNISSQEHDECSQSVSEPDSVIAILRELSSTVKRLETKIDNMDKDRKKNEKEVRKIQIVQQQDSAAISTLKETSADHDDQIKILSGIVLRQQQQIDDLTHKLNNVFIQNNTKKLIIHGLAETQNENCFHEVANFFKNIMKITQAIPLKFARRIGAGETRAMLIKLKMFEHKSLIFQNFDKLKAANRSRQAPYYINEQLPEAWAERRRFVQHIKHQNSRLPADAQHTITIKNNKIQCNGEQYVPPFSPPSVTEILGLSTTDKEAINMVELSQGSTETVGDSKFLGYAAQAFSTDQIRRQYLYLKLLHPQASHISVAFRIPGTDFVTNQGLVDDGEHGGARAIMKVLFKEKVENTAVFIVRYFQGKHIGSVRFHAIEKAAKSALEKMMMERRNARRLPTQQELAQINFEIQQAAQNQVPAMAHPWKPAPQLQEAWGEQDNPSADENNDTEQSQTGDSDSA